MQDQKRNLLSTIPVITEEKEWIAVNKPAGISVHNNEDRDNLLSTLEKQLNHKSLFPVHRLDKETSGVQILALTEKAARDLATEFQNKNTDKFYTGVLRGQLKLESGLWQQALTDKAEGRKNPAGLGHQRIPCATEFKVLRKNKYFSYCEFKILTGRQHQIRKHSALSNHAIVGDSRYGDTKYNQKISNLYKNERMFLHSQKIRILNIEISCADEFSFLLNEPATVCEKSIKL